MKIELFKCSGKIVPLEKKPTLPEMQKLVGGYVEHVLLKHGAYLMVNEDGHALNLPRNPKASELYGGLILGDAILFWKGEK